MSHSLNKVWIHAIWTTKERQPLIDGFVEKKIYQFIHEQFRELACPLRIVNGMPDHIHCLFLLNSQKSVAEVIKQVKGSTSHYINHDNMIRAKFAWQTGYAAFSVSESVHERVYHYIRNQKKHHARKSFQQEYDAFISVHGLEATIHAPAHAPAHG